MKHLVWATLLFAILAHAGTPQVAVRTYRGVWQTGTSYVQGETTFYQGQTYIAVVDNQGVTPGTDETKWTQKGASDVVISPSSTAPGSVPSGMILFIDTGSCPVGWTELAAAGNYLLLTQAANNDAGTTGGSNSYTPQGTVSQPTLTMNSYTPAGTIPAHTGTQKFTTSGSGTVALTGTATNIFTGTAATLTGSVSQPTLTGTPATIQPTYVRLIGCKKQ